ncbi:ABC transporter permease [Emticicia sp. BO119]|uniref:ABC transporter permease n=1 Tax=Emticicia sp. BO119 TaxID=2757768 RepID=UPI0015F11CFF|nr:ABC transporter permease [Emticicia sp. BO119]MBA4850861.1 ABC transporter permease [Emticicia sp. BO119]
MISNYLKIAFRNLIRNKVFSFINIIGLALGLAVSTLILLFVSHEVSYDTFHKNYKRIYQVGASLKMGEQQFNFSNMSPRLGDALKENSASVQAVGRKAAPWNVTLETDPKHRFDESGFVFADEGFFKVFDFKILQGNISSITRPYTIFLTPEMAFKYFGKENPIGKTLKWNRKTDLEVVGIVEKNPSNSSIEFNFLTSLSTNILENKKNYPDYYTDKKLNEIATGDYETFLLLDAAESEPNVLNILKKITAEDSANKDITFRLNYFANHLGVGGEKLSDRLMYVYISSAVAILILLLALVNFMNLTTARATTRAKEVGVRKSIGANRLGLTTQFYVESTLTIFIACTLAIVLFKALQPVLYKLLELKIDIGFLLNPYFLVSLGSVLLISILLAGSYPAFVLSKFNPIEVLKGKFQGKGNAAIRQSLTVFQLAVSSVLIFCSIIIFGQIKKMRAKNLGLNKDQIVTINLDGQARTKNQALLNEIKQIDGVQNVSGSKHRIFAEGYNVTGLKKIGARDNSIASMVGTIIFDVDTSYMDLFAIQWKVKPERLPSNLKNKILLNESAVKALGGNVDIIKNLEMGQGEPVEVVGVFKDFNYIDVKHEIKPLMLKFITDTQEMNHINIKISKEADIVNTIAQIEKTYNGYKVESAFTYYFADDSFDKLFKSEDRIANIFGAFTGIAIFIACLGLFGLITFMAEQKTKEIGIRKVLGATVFNITTMLSKGFLKLAMVSIGISVPIAYYAMTQWLQDFTYRIELSWWIFAAGGIGITLLALLTVGYQAVRAALMNPVKSLKSE